ncbi:MAG: adenylyl-sulfate kinase [Nisaea sp.]|uniref:adenylyl-sulfate kinase n=1 Tax=Nisaea sp. TaxID=2024842 RepID=UPI001B0A8874|nr:adenylyl-sulfate kinase [Nisaea sp.]MBO6561227.1 adenylyl-sulfate kinase [Nisaea sp.]
MTLSSESPALKLVVVGHVDHGKSTLIGRLLHDTDSLPDGKAEAVIKMSERRGMPVEWAFVLDALQAERDQGITIDTTQIFFNTDKRNYVIIDAPGHKEFLKNMVSGAALSDAALLVIDAKDGMQEQSRRHGYILHLLGVRQVAVVINKMDLVEYREERYQELTGEIRKYLSGLGLEAAAIVPISAREGQGMVARPDRMPWYEGPHLVEVLDGFNPPVLPTDRPLRLPVQDVYKFDERRIIAGRIESGRIHTGDRILISPSNKTVTVKSIESWNVKDPALGASAGQSVGITLSEQLFIERGQVISHESNPPIETNVFRARIFWLGKKPLEVGKRYKLKLATNEQTVEVQSIETVIDVENLTSSAGDKLERNGIGEVTLRARAMLALDEFAENPKTGRFVLVDEYDTVGGGIIFMEGYPDQRARGDVRSTNITAVEHRVTPDLRARANGHEGGILWLTGLSGAGKSTLAIEAEQQLFAKGYQVYVLDGDNIRFGLSSDLGFAPEDRAENIRRVGEVAKLFASAGVLVLTAFISPYRADRDRARSIAPDLFHEVYVAADVATCEGRDPKGLYKKARAGEIKDFTGVSAPYEEPVTPELTVDTSDKTVNESVAELLAYVEENFSLTRNGGGR